MGNIWNNAFKSGGEIGGTTLKNGIRSRVSLSSVNTSGRATICFSLTAAIVAMVQGRVSIAKTVEGNIWTESESYKKGRMYVVEYDPDAKTLSTFASEDGEMFGYSFTDRDFSHWSLFVPRIVELLGSSEEFSENFQVVTKEYEENGVIGASNEIFVLNDYLYETKSEYVEYSGDILDADIMVSSLQEDMTERLLGMEGNFEFGIFIDAEKEAEKEIKKEKKETKKGDSREDNVLSLDWDRELTKEEKDLIPKLDFNIIKVQKEVKELAFMIKEEINSLKPVCNILLYGEAGAGKSTGARVLAQLLGLPYRFVTCSLNTEESDFVGTYIPTVDGGFEFWMPSFAQTFVNGGVIEVQEPTTLKAGVGVALNSATDDTGKITLGSGEVVKRHKNCIIVFTTNVGYEGCFRMNESVKDRFNQMLHIKKLPDKELIKLTMEQSGNSDVTLVAKLVDAVEKMSIKIEEEMISGGVCSTRQLINWAQDIKYTKNPIRSARKTVLPGVSLDLETQEEIVDTILRPMF